MSNGFVMTFKPHRNWNTWNFFPFIVSTLVHLIFKRIFSYHPFIFLCLNGNWTEIRNVHSLKTSVIILLEIKVQKIQERPNTVIRKEKLSEVNIFHFIVRMGVGRNIP